MNEIRLRAATLDDIPALVAFGEAVIPTHYTPILGEHAAHSQLGYWSPDRFPAAIADGRVHIATSGNEILGVVETGNYDGEQVIWKLYVAPSARNQGLGVKLVNLAISELSEATNHVLIEHFAGNVAAARFYEREGFKVTHIEQNLENPNGSVVWRRREITQ